MAKDNQTIQTLVKKSSSYAKESKKSLTWKTWIKINQNVITSINKSIVLIGYYQVQLLNMVVILKMAFLIIDMIVGLAV